MKILVFGGGDSPERDVSQRSAKSVADAARNAGFDVEEADPKYKFDRIDKISKNTLIFPILHGKNGEDGIIQKEFEARQLAYLGSDSKSSEICFDKWQTHQKLEAAGLPMPKAILVSRETYFLQPMAKQPHVLKILHGGSSIGTLILSYPDPLKNPQIEKLFQLENHAIIEELIEGTEITVAILDQQALPVIEIIPPENEEFDYDNRYNGRTQELCPPQSVSVDIQKKAQRLSEKVNFVMGCRHLSRVDLMLDAMGNLFVLEINTIPGLTDQSLYPKAAAAAGMDMPSLTKKFVELVQRDYGI